MVNMCKAIQGIKEDVRLEGRLEGKLEGARENSIETAKKVLALGKLTLEEVSVIYNLSIDDVKKNLLQKHKRYHILWLSERNL